MVKKDKNGKDSEGQNNRIRERGIDPSVTGSRTQDVLPEGYMNSSESAQNGDRQRNPNTSPNGGSQNQDRENPQQEEQQEENNPEFPQQDENNQEDYYTRVRVGSNGDFEVVREPLGPGENNRNSPSTENGGTTPTEEQSSSDNQQQQRETNGQSSQQNGDAPVDDQPERLEPSRNPDNGRVRSPLGGVGAVLGKKVRTIKRPFEKGNRLATAGKVAKFTAKAAGTALGAATLGAVGLGAGLTSGDLSKTASLTSAGLTLGATAGNKTLAGGSIALASATARTIQNDRETYRRATRSAEQYEREEQEKIDQEWIRDPKNYEYLRNHEMSDKEAKAWLKSEKVARYRRETGISDIKTLHRTMKLIDKNHYSHDYGIHLAKMVDRTSAEFKESEVNNVRKNLQEQDGISLEAANKVIKDMMYVKDISIPD